MNFGKGDRRFLAKRLWTWVNEPRYLHHGMFTMLRQAFQRLEEYDRDSVIGFLESRRPTQSLTIEFTATYAGNNFGMLPLVITSD